MISRPPTYPLDRLANDIDAGLALTLLRAVCDAPNLSLSRGHRFANGVALTNGGQFRVLEIDLDNKNAFFETYGAREQVETVGIESLVSYLRLNGYTTNLPE